MRRPKAATPAPAAAGNRCQGVLVGRLDAPRSTKSHLAPQPNLAARIVAVRFGWVYPLAYLPRLLSRRARRESAPPWQVQVPQHPPFVAQPPQPPNMGKALPTLPAVAPNQGSKILTYLPLIIGLNVLFLIAVLFILLFALKR